MNFTQERQFLLDFYPLHLQNLLGETPKIREKVLKKEYLIHIVSSLIIRYYFSKENKFKLNSEVLKSNYGKYYNYYIQFLLEGGVIVLKKDYSRGSSSRIYALTDRVLASSLQYYENSDRVLNSKKYLEKKWNWECNTSSIMGEIREKLVSDLYSIDLDVDLSQLYLLDRDYEHQLDIERDNFILQAISRGSIYYHFDEYGRFHTPFTILPKPIRDNCLTIEGERLCEIDIPNSQPLFLTKLIQLHPQIPVNPDEFEKFREMVFEGSLYKEIMGLTGLKSNKEVKKLVFETFFGKSHAGSGARIFGKLFPSILNFIKLIKKEKGNYRWLSHQLQKIESHFIFNRVVSRIYQEIPDCKIFTVHDSIFCQVSHYQKVLEIFQDEFNQLFVRQTAETTI